MQNSLLGGRNRPPDLFNIRILAACLHIVINTGKAFLIALSIACLSSSLSAQQDPTISEPPPAISIKDLPPPPPLRVLTPLELQALEIMRRKSRPMADFSGEQVTELQGGRTSRQRVRGDVRGRIRIDYLEPKSLEGDIMIIAPDQFRNFHHATNTLDIALWPSPENDREKRLMGAIRNGMMSIQRVGEETIAGRSANIVSISTLKRTGRFPGGQAKYWLDNETGIQLKNEISNASGLVSRTFITSIVVGPAAGVVGKDFFFTFPGAKVNPLFPHNEPKFHNLSEAAGHLPFPPVEPSSMPPGYQMSGIWVLGAHRDQVVGNESLLLRYSDGVTHFTLYEKHARADRENRPRHAHPRSSNRNIERWFVNSAAGPLEVIYIGHLPVEQVEAMSQSLK